MKYKFNPTILRQLLDIVPRHIVQNKVDQRAGDKWVRKLTGWAQLAVLVYAQLRQRDSLRGIETSLEVQSRKLYHLGIPAIKRSTLAEANERRDYRIFQDIFMFLLGKCHAVARGKIPIPKKVYLLDATLIQLCYSLFDWAKYRTQKGAMKLHLLLNLNLGLPEVVVMTEGNIHEINIARTLELPPDSILIMDRAYLDFQWLYSLHQRGVTFIIRAKKDLSYTSAGQHEIPVESVVLSDEDILVPWRAIRHPEQARYPVPLRLITTEDPETGELVRFLTNNEDYQPETIGRLYKARWQIETFFRWIKQTLKIKPIYGTSKNAVFTQIWTALITYLLLWYLKMQSRHPGSLLTLFRVLDELILERTSFVDVLSLTSADQFHPPPNMQLALF